MQDCSRQASREADVLLLCGDLTDYGLPEEARAARGRHSRARRASRHSPCSAITISNPAQAEAVRKVLEDAGVTMLDGEATRDRRRRLCRRLRVWRRFRTANAKRVGRAVDQGVRAGSDRSGVAAGAGAHAIADAIAGSCCCTTRRFAARSKASRRRSSRSSDRRDWRNRSTASASRLRFTATRTRAAQKRRRRQAFPSSTSPSRSCKAARRINSRFASSKSKRARQFTPLGARRSGSPVRPVAQEATRRGTPRPQSAKRCYRR